MTKPLEDFSRVALRRLARMYPFYRGLWRIVESPLAHKLSRGDEVVSTRLWKGPRIIVQLNDYCGRAIYFGGAQDRRVEMFCARFLNRGDAVVDIGANNGVLGLRAASVVGPEGQVHCFEPQPRLAESIRKSAALNGFANLTVHSVALSDKNGEADFCVPKGNSGTASLEKTGGVEDMIRVPLKHAGEYLDGLKLTKVRLLKIDVEGHEYPIFQAARQWIQKVQVDAVVFESLEDGKPFADRPLVRLLNDVSYEMFQVKPDSWMRPALVRLNSAEDVRPGTDFVAMRKGVDVAKFCTRG